MRTGGRLSTWIVLLLTILAVQILAESAKADEPGEDVIQELIHGDARAASTVSSRAPLLGMCKMQTQGSNSALANEMPAVPDDFSGGTIVAPHGSSSLPFVAAISSYCKLYDLLARGDFDVRKVGCVKSQNSLGYNCDFIIQPKTSEGEEAAIVGQFFNPSTVHTSRFVLFESKWYLASDTSPFAGAGFIRGVFSPR